MQQEAGFHACIYDSAKGVELPQSLHASFFHGLTLTPSSTCSCLRLQSLTLPLLVLHQEVHPRPNVAFFYRLSGGRRDEETAKNSQKRHYLHPLSLRFLDVVKGRGLYIISHLSLMVWSRAVEVVLGLFAEVFRICLFFQTPRQTNAEDLTSDLVLMSAGGFGRIQVSAAHSLFPQKTKIQDILSCLDLNDISLI